MPAFAVISSVLWMWTFNWGGSALNCVTKIYLCCAVKMNKNLSLKFWENFGRKYILNLWCKWTHVYGLVPMLSVQKKVVVCWEIMMFCFKILYIYIPLMLIIEWRPWHFAVIWRSNGGTFMLQNNSLYVAALCIAYLPICSFMFETCKCTQCL